IPTQVDDYLATQTTALGNPNDRFGAGVLTLDAAVKASDALRQKVKNIVLDDQPDLLEGQLSVIREVFRLGIARGAMLAIGAADPDSVKTMARPFDFDTFQPRSDLPANYAAEDYLQIASVINTIYSVFDVDKSLWRSLVRGGPAAPILQPLVA